MATVQCRHNPPGNPYFCEIIRSYCQFQTESLVNDHCPICHEYPNGLPNGD